MGLPRGLSINYLHPNLKGSLGALSATIATNRTDAGPAVTSVGQQLSAVGALVGSVAKPSAQNAAATLSELTLQTAGLAYVAILERSIQKTLTLGTFNLDIAISRLTEALQVLKQANQAAVFQARAGGDLSQAVSSIVTGLNTASAAAIRIVGA